MARITGSFLFIIVVVSGLLSLGGCQGKPSVPVRSPANPDGQTAFQVLLRGATLYQQPDLDAAVVATLAPGTRLVTLAPVGPALARLQRGGTALVTAWLNVRSVEGNTGWILADPDLFFTSAQDEAARIWLRDQRLAVILGPAEWEALCGARKLWQSAEQAELLLFAFRVMRRIRATVEKALTRIPLADLDPAWLAGGLPGLQLGRSDPPRLWLDYKAWLERSLASKGEADDRIFELYCRVYPADSLEYFYPVWRFPVDRQQAYSLLGRDIHTRLLRAADTLLAAYPSTQADVTMMTAALLDDMLSDEVAYWESREKLVAELVALLDEPPRFLTAAQKVRLNQRLHVFRSGDATGPLTNLRAGQVGAGAD